MNDINDLRNPKTQKIEGSNSQLTAHYYGDLVRKLFLAGGVIMIFGLPFMKNLFNLPIYIPLTAILVLAYLAGLTSPRQHLVTWFNLAVATIAFVVFEIYAVRLFKSSDAFWFVANQLEALIFLTALYFSTKTLRAMNTK